MFKEIAVPIPLKVWQDPQGNPFLVDSEHRTVVYLRCWTDDCEPADFACEISFQHGWASRMTHIEFSPYKINDPHRSAIYEVVNSSWLKEATKRRKKCYPQWKSWDKNVYHHYVIEGHDCYLEVLAENFTEKTIALETVKGILPLFHQDFL